MAKGGPPTKADLAQLRRKLETNTRGDVEEEILELGSGCDDGLPPGDPHLIDYRPIPAYIGEVRPPRRLRHPGSHGMPPTLPLDAESVLVVLSSVPLSVAEILQRLGVSPSKNRRDRLHSLLRELAEQGEVRFIHRASSLGRPPRCYFLPVD